MVYRMKVGIHFWNITTKEVKILKSQISNQKMENNTIHGSLNQGRILIEVMGYKFA